MESVIIEEMRAFLRLDLPDRQRQYFTDTIAVAKRVEVVKRRTYSTNGKLN